VQIHTQNENNMNDQLHQDGISIHFL